MDRSREARRVAMPTSNGLTRRRHRTSSLRDSPEDDGPLELQESARFRDRTGKKDKDREKDRSERDRLSRSKRRRGEKYMHGSNREDAVDDSSEESLNDEDEEDLEDAPVRFMPPNPVSVSSSSIPSSALTSSRKSYPPPSKVMKVTPSWRSPNETIGFSIPRRARSASTKRAHDSLSSAGVVGEQILRQTSSSPVRPSMAASSTVASPSPAPMSPSSSSLSIKKKIKGNGPKQRPQKSSSKSPCTVQDIEIEVAEVLYGLMRQSQGSSKQELMRSDSARYDSREANRSTGDSKSRASSPVSNSGSVPAQDSPAMPQNTSSSAPPLSAVAPKRKRPRPVNQPEEKRAGFAFRSGPISTAPKMEPDLPAKQEVHPPKSENNSDSAAENGVSLELLKSHGPQSTREAVRSEPASGVLLSEEKRSSVVDQSQGKDTVMVGKVEEVPSSKKESVDDRVHYTAIKQITTTSTGEKESRREEKFEIDLMAPPPQSRSSPVREGEMDHHHEPMVTDGEAEIKSKPSEGEKAGRAVSSGNADLNAEVVEKGSKSSGARAEDADAQKLNLSNKAKNIDLHLDLERLDRSPVPSSAEDNKLNQQLQKQPPLKSLKDDASADRNAQPSSLPLSLPVPAGWPAGLPPMGYVAPLQGVVSMDGRTMAPTAMQPPHFLFNQPRPGRCATHCYIAKNIYSHQQFMKNYTFWPTAAGAAPLFGAKPYNLNVVPAADLHNAAGRADVNPAQDKGQTLAFFPGQQAAVKDKGAQPAANMVDGAQKKQFYQSLPPGGPNNLVHGPATLFFPLGQQVAAAGAAGAASARTNSIKSPVPAGTAASASMSTSMPNASATAGLASSTTMSFNYPNANETQYLAILANGAYQIPIPAHVGAAQAYRGAPAHVMPFFNGSYYPSQILQPSRVQQPPQPVQIQQNHQNHQNPSISIASSSSQKHPQNQQQRPQGSSGNGVTTNPALQNFPAPKTRASQTQQLEMGGEGSPSTADSRLSRPPNMSLYGQNIAFPFNPSNFAFMSPPASLSGAGNGNHAEKKQQQPPQAQQQALKTSVESLAPQAFAMSFASINGVTASLDIASMAKNHAILQSFPDTARNSYHMMAPALHKNYHGSEDGKSGAPDSSKVDGEKKGTAAKASASTQSISFSRPDLVETSVATVSGNNVVDSSGRSLNVVPGSAHSSRSSVPNAISNSPASSSQQQQFVQLQKQQQFAAATTRNKAPVTSNGSVYSDQLATAMAPKFPNALPGYPPSVVQGSNTSTQSPQWKNSGRPITSQVSSPSIATPVTTSMKSIGQLQSRTQQGQTPMSFGGNSKATTASQGQQGPNVTQSPSPPMMVGSPSTSSVSKGQSGSPRMTSSSSVGNKPAQASSLSTQPGKNSPSVSSQKSSPAAGSGRNVPSVFGSNHMLVSSSMGSSKPQLQQQSQHQLQQPQLSKQSIHQAQMFFSNAYFQTHSTTSSSAASAVGGFQLQRHRTEQHQLPSKSQGGPTTTSANATKNDPAKAVVAAAAAAAAAGNIKGGKQHQGTIPATVFPHVHEVVAAAARMQAERKQTAD